MQNAIVFAENDIAVVAWSYGAKIPGCMGFAVYRIDSTGVETPLPSMAVFPGSRRRRARPPSVFRSRSSTGRIRTRVSSPTRPARGAFATRSFRWRASPAASSR